MKQRRRWMNGALFGTSKVLLNASNMVCCRTKHSCGRKLMVTVYLLYLFATFTLQMFMVGSLFATTMVFVQQGALWTNKVYEWNLPVHLI
jgi:uncharacterized membrane protein